MNDAFYDFKWPVAPSYAWQRWVDANGAPLEIPMAADDQLLGLDSEGSAVLTWSHALETEQQFGPVLSPVMANASELRHYQPMQREHAALFRVFAEVNFASQDAVMEFATRYGLLGLPLQTQSISFPQPTGHNGVNFAYGEAFLDWAAEICLMREGLRLVERSRTPDNSRRLKWLFDRHLQHVQARLSFDGAGKPRLLLEPLTLIAALWLQLALAVTGDKRFVTCKFCRGLFEISTALTGFRRHREFCSDSCKTMDYRKRKRAALEMLKSGAGPKQISEATGTNATTVRKWLGALRAPSSKARKGDA